MAWNTPARNFDEADLRAELSEVERKWDDYFSDPDFEGHGGSPGEWMAERMDELRAEIGRRALPTPPGAQAQTSAGGEIKRFDLYDRGFDDYTMKVFPNGHYVTFEDHQAAILAERERMQPVENLTRTRFKLSFNKSKNCTSLYNFADELEGKWVWLIDAEDGKNCPLWRALPTPPINPPVPEGEK